MGGNMSGMKVLHVAAGPRMFTQFRMPMIRRQKEACARLVLYCPFDELAGTLIAEGFEMHDAPVTNRPGMHTLFEVARLCRFLKRERFDVVIAHQPMGAVVGITAAFIAGVPVKVYSTGGLKWSPDVKGAFNLLMKYGELGIIKMSDAAFLVNREDEASLKGMRASAGKAFYVGPRGGCGVDTSVFNRERRTALRDAARAELGIGADEFVVGYVGRLVWEKGFRELVDSAYTVCNGAGGEGIRFLILGMGPDEAAIKGYVEERGLASRFVFAGYRQDVARCMSAFDLFVLPSYREGLPVALLDAMAMGLPCVATDIRGARDLITDGKTGVLVPVRDAGGLADAIAGLRADENKRAMLGREGERRVHAEFEEGLLVGRTMEVLDMLVKG